MQAARTILFITGECLSHECWEQWRYFFEALGFNTLAPGWKYKDAPAGILRSRHPDEEFENLAPADLINHYRSIICNLEKKPVLVTHAAGTVIAKRMMKDKLVAGAVLIEEDYLRTWLRKILLSGIILTSGKLPSFLVPYSLWRTAFAYRMPGIWQQDSYRLMIPESAGLLQQLQRSGSMSDPSVSSLPVLHIRITAKKIPASSEPEHPLLYHRFGQRNCLFMVQPGWQEIAACIADWLIQNFSLNKTQPI